MNQIIDPNNNLSDEKNLNENNESKKEPLIEEGISNLQKNLGQGIEVLIPKKNEDSFKNIETNIEKTFQDLRNNYNHLFQEEAINDKENNLETQNLKESVESVESEDNETFKDKDNNEIRDLRSNEGKKDQDLEDLNSLLEEKVFYIETDKIKPNPLQPRKVFSEESIEELAQSIREYGILEPLVVTRVEKETEKGTIVEYQLISGERRLLAAKKLGLPTVPVIIRKPIEERRKLELALIENIQREDLDPISKAQAFYKLINDFSLTQQELAEKLGKSREFIANTLRLLQLPLEAQNALREGKINEAHARAILFFNHPEKRRAFLKEILARNLSGREALELAQRLTSKRETVSRRRNISLQPEDLEIKEKLEEVLGTPVYIKKKGDQGAIEIKFYSQKELENIIKKILF